jgi:hypothetical protein
MPSLVLAWGDRVCYDTFGERSAPLKELLALAAAVFAVQATPFAQATASLDLLSRAINPNPTLNSYTASAHLSATLHVVIPVHKSYGGIVYYLRPKRKIEFQGVSGALSRFKDLASSTPTYDEATQQYAITPLTDTGGVSKYVLVPKKTGSRVKSVAVNVDDQAALVNHVVWSYTNGGTLTFDQTYTSVGEFHLPAQANIAARFPGYSVDGTITFGGYKPNATVSPSVFTASQ